MIEIRRRHLSAIALALAVLAASRGARADGEPAGLGARHHWVISVEHLAGYVHTSTTGGPDSAGDLWLFGNTPWPNAVLSPSSGYVAPRVAFDVFVAEHLSLGTSALFSKSHDAVWHVILGPRLGVAFDLSRSWSVWGRFGFTYVHQDDESAGTFAATTNLYAVSADIPFALRFGHGVFMSFAPTLDVGAGGSTRTEVLAPGFGAPQTRSIRQTSVGFQCALGAYF